MTKTRKHRKYRWQVKLAILSIALAGVSLSAEIGARIWIHRQYHKEVAKYRSSPYLVAADSSIEYRLHPNLSRTVRLNKLEWSYTTNSRGFRGGEIDPAQPVDSKRILFFGDSVTFGYGVADSETLPAQFEALWNNQERKPFKIQSINLGVPGYNTIQELASLEEQFDVWKPDAIVLTYVVNDAEPQATVPGRPAQVFRFVNSWFLEEIETELNEIFFIGDPYFSSKKYRHAKTDLTASFAATNVKSKESKAALQKIAQFCGERRVPFLLAVSPDVSTPLSDKYPFAQIHEVVMGWAREFEINSIDLLPVVLGQRSEDLSVPGDGHPNAEAHRQFALNLLPELERALNSD